MPSRLAQHLIAKGVLAADMVETAFKRHAAGGGAFDTVLLEQGQVSEEDLLRALGEVSGLPTVQLGDFEPSAEAAGLLPFKVVERLCVVPLSVDGSLLHIASAYPVARSELREVSFLLNRELKLWVALEVRVRDWMASVYGAVLSARHAVLLAALDPSRGLSLAKVAEMQAFREGTTLEAALEKSVGGSQPEPIPLKVKKVHRGEPKASDGQARALAPNDAVVADEDAVAQESPPTVETAKRPWTVDEAKAELKANARDRDAIMEVALRFARQTFEFAAAFAVVRGTATYWDSDGAPSGRAPDAGLVVPLDAPSVFRTVAVTRGTYAGPAPQDEATKKLLSQLGRAPRAVFLYAVEVKGRLVAILYGDCGKNAISQRRLSEFILFAQHLAEAFEDLILFRKQRYGQGLSFSMVIEGESVPLSSWFPHAPEPSARPPYPEAKSPQADELLALLVGHDVAARGRAMERLLASPGESARVLAKNFPGPTAWSRLPVEDLPDADELGPVPAALSRLGQAGARELAPLLVSEDPSTRYFALLTAGALPYPELVEGMTRGLFDLEPDVSSAARAAAFSFRRLPEFAQTLGQLHQQLGARDPLRRTLAARALGALHDAGGVVGLIGLTGSEDDMCAAAAAGALFEITGALHGASCEAWLRWWSRNKGKTRAEWLVDALADPELEVRLAAIEQLSPLLNDNLGFLANGPASEREAAVRRWRLRLAESDALRSADF